MFFTLNYSDIFTHVHPAQPASVPRAPREMGVLLYKL